MTIEDLADLSADKLEKLTDKELEDILRPYFIVTRPELAPKPEKRQESNSVMASMTPKKLEALRQLKEQNPDLDLSFLNQRRKPK